MPVIVDALVCSLATPKTVLRSSSRQHFFDVFLENFRKITNTRRKDKQPTLQLNQTCKQPPPHPPPLPAFSFLCPHTRGPAARFPFIPSSRLHESRFHYTFNLRDISKVFQGFLMITAPRCPAVETAVRLWAHECSRVFYDRLINREDQEWFEQLVLELLPRHLRVTTVFFVCIFQLFGFTYGFLFMLFRETKTNTVRLTPERSGFACQSRISSSTWQHCLLGSLCKEINPGSKSFLERSRVFASHDRNRKACEDTRVIIQFCGYFLAVGFLLANANIPRSFAVSTSFSG